MTRIVQGLGFVISAIGFIMGGPLGYKSAGATVFVIGFLIITVGMCAGLWRHASTFESRLERNAFRAMPIGFALAVIGMAISFVRENSVPGEFLIVTVGTVLFLLAVASWTFAVYRRQKRSTIERD